LNPLVDAPASRIPLPPQFAGLRDRRILVTGVGGFIGGALFQRLVAYGLDVLGTVQYEEEAETLRARGFSADVLDLADLVPWDPLVAGRDLVFHVAAAFQETELPESAYDVANHQAPLELARVAAAAGVSRFVHCSTVGVHGDVLELPATERTPFHPMDVYHRTKLAGELAVVEFAVRQPEDGMVVVVNRPAMVYGPGDTRLLKLYQAILRRQFVMIGSGATLAHLGYIDDQVDSFLLCALRPRADVHGEAFNIASGTPIPLTELASLIAASCGVRLRRLKVPLAPVLLAGRVCEALCAPFGLRPPLSRRRVGFFSHNRAFDLTKARERLGYESAWLPDEGIPATIAWYRENDLL
jgi:nucleoside-diphosphate-sugar epimerase